MECDNGLIDSNIVKGISQCIIGAADLKRIQDTKVDWYHKQSLIKHRVTNPHDEKYYDEYERITREFKDIINYWNTFGKNWVSKGYQQKIREYTQFIG
jgi:hypothetical protein